MTAVSLAAGHTQPPGSGDPPGGPPQTLADEHMLLLGQVAVRAGELLAAAARGRWPAAELAALTGYIRAEVLRQVSGEEMLLFPAAPSAAAALARDHARLRAGADLLQRVASGEQGMASGQLAAAAGDFVTQLERHLSAEETALAAADPPGTVAATTALGWHPHEWYPLTEGPAIDLGALPAGQAVAAAVARLLRLGSAEQVELQWGCDLSPVWREMDRLSPGGYGFVSLQDGPGRWRMRVTRRHAAA
jgi:Hemerythrin HHE cation binding domain